MKSRGYLGELEIMLLLAVIHLGEEAYGIPIVRELELHREKNVSVGSVYAALERSYPRTGWQSQTLLSHHARGPAAGA
jgi:hypothetical protein